MNKKEWLLVCLAEELGEVQKEVHKALRFGVSDINPKSGVSNFESIKQELIEVNVLISMLFDKKVFTGPMNLHDDTAKRLKQERVAKYMLYAIEKGIIVD